jgi:hypothetical protein
MSASWACENGSSGTATPRESQSGSQPWLTWKNEQALDRDHGLDLGDKLREGAHAC